jgi:hypothetical protein
MINSEITMAATGSAHHHESAALRPIPTTRPDRIL